MKLPQYSSILRQYSLILSQYSSILRQYSLIFHYSSILWQYSSILWRYHGNIPRYYSNIPRTLFRHCDDTPPQAHRRVPHNWLVRCSDVSPPSDPRPERIPCSPLHHYSSGVLSFRYGCLWWCATFGVFGAFGIIRMALKSWLCWESCSHVASY